MPYINDDALDFRTDDYIDIMNDEYSESFLHWWHEKSTPKAKISFKIDLLSAIYEIIEIDRELSIDDDTIERILNEKLWLEEIDEDDEMEQQDD